MNTRRQFLKLTGTGILTAGISKVYGDENPSSETKKKRALLLLQRDFINSAFAGQAFLLPGSISARPEYKNDMNDPLPGIAESIGYFKGVMDCR